MTRISIQDVPKWNERLVREKNVPNPRGKVTLVLEIGDTVGDRNSWQTGMAFVVTPKKADSLR